MYVPLSPFYPSSSDYVGLAVGITIAAIVLTVILPICIIVIVYCCIFGGALAVARSQNRHPQVITATPAGPPQAAVVQTTATTQQPVYPAGAYPVQAAPPPAYNPDPGYPQQQGGYPQQQAYPAQPDDSPAYPPPEKPVDQFGAPYPA